MALKFVMYASIFANCKGSLETFIRDAYAFDPGCWQRQQIRFHSYINILLVPHCELEEIKTPQTQESAYQPKNLSPLLDIAFSNNDNRTIFYALIGRLILENYAYSKDSYPLFLKGPARFCMILETLIENGNFGNIRLGSINSTSYNYNYVYLINTSEEQTVMSMFSWPLLTRLFQYNINPFPIGNNK